MAGTIGEALISIGADASDFSRSVESSVKGPIQKVGATLGQALGRTLQNGAAIAGAGITAVLGTALTAGFSRLNAIDQANAKLTGLGYTGTQIEAVMTNALASVKGTAFGLGDAASVAAGLLASGIQQGTELEGVLKTVADTAAISGRSLTDIGLIFQSVAARGKLQGDDMLQLMSSGIPVLQLLADQLGVTSAEVSEMVSRGEVDFATFAAAMDAGFGGAALASGNTFTGALANMRAALGRLGAAILEPAFSAGPGIFGAITAAIDTATEAVGPLVTQIGERLAGALEQVGPVIESLATRFSEWVGGADLSSLTSGLSEVSGLLIPLGGLFAGIVSSFLTGIPVIGRMFGGLTGPMGLVLGALTLIYQQSPALRDALGGALESISAALGSATPAFTVLADFVAVLAEVLGNVLAAALNTLLPLALSLAGVLGGALLAALQFITPLLQSMAQWINENQTAVGAIIGVLIAWKAATMAMAAARAVITGITAATYGAAGASYAAGAAATVYKVATTAMNVATKAAAAAQWLWNAAMSANPIGLLIAGIAALVAGLVWFFTQTEAGQRIVEAVWGAIKGAIGAVVDWWTGSVLPALTGFWDTLKGAAEAVSNWFTGTLGPALSGVWQGIQAAIEPVVAWFQTNVGPIFTAVGELIMAIWGRIQEGAALLQAGLQVIWTGITEAWNAVWAGLQAAWDAVGQPVIDFVVEGFTNLWTGLQAVWAVVVEGWNNMLAGIQAAWESFGQPIIDFVISSWQTLQTFASTVWTAIQTVIAGVWSAIQTVISTYLTVIKTVISTVWNNIKVVIETVLGVIKGVINAVTSAIKGDWSGAWNAIKGVADTIWSGIRAVIDNAINGVKSVISTVLGSIKSIWSSAWETVKSAASTIWNGIKSAINDGINNAMSTVRGFKDKILGFFAGAGTWLRNAGKSIIEGLINGIKSMASAVTGAVGDVLAAARDLLPFSPAKVGPFSGRGWTLYSGESIIDALAKGVQNRKDSLVSAVNAAVGAAHDAAALPNVRVSAPALPARGTNAGSPGASGEMVAHLSRESLDYLLAGLIRAVYPGAEAARVLEDLRLRGPSRMRMGVRA